MTEKQLHKAVCDYLSVVLPSTVRFYTVPNDGARGQPGLTRGVPDLAFVRQGGSCAFIELKTDKGRLSEHQAAWLDWCAENGVDAAVCRSLDDVRACLEAWQIRTREAA